MLDRKDSLAGPYVSHIRPNIGTLVDAGVSYIAREGGEGGRRGDKR